MDNRAENGRPRTDFKLRREKNPSMQFRAVCFCFKLRCVNILRSQKAHFRFTIKVFSLTMRLCLPGNAPGLEEMICHVVVIHSESAQS
jgi:hypothetical protein